jgi:anti-anti-sigma regulatory factor
MNIRVVWLGAVVLVWADGTLDGSVVAEMHGALEALLADEPATVVLDLHEVNAVDEGGIAVLAATAARLSHQGAVLELRLPGGRAQAVAGAAQLRAVLTEVFRPA